jgi:sec-independent protein translocase protein TatB
MFDIGFWELCLIATVALLVLGPERLPIAARTAGKWFGKFRSMVTNVKSEIDRELQLDELRRKMADQEQQLREQSGMDDFKQTVDETVADLSSLGQQPHAKTDSGAAPTKKPDQAKHNDKANDS